MAAKSGTRFAASFKALGIVWLVSGLLFCFIIKGPQTVAAWTIWGSAVFIVGWLIVALPLIALGDRVFRIPVPLLACAGGLAGALLMFSPNVIVRIANREAHYVPFSMQDLAWPGIAFAIAAPATALYLFFLKKAPAAETNFEEFERQQ